MHCKSPHCGLLLYGAYTNVAISISAHNILYKDSDLLGSSFCGVANFEERENFLWQDLPSINYSFVPLIFVDMIRDNLYVFEFHTTTRRGIFRQNIFLS